jgi:hypothetical protein
MTGQNFKSIREPESKNDWFIVETDSGFYELRLGGIQRVDTCKSTRTLDLPFSNVQIKQVLTDDFAVIIELYNGQCIIHSDTYLHGDGLTAFEIRTVDKDVIEKDGGLEGMSPLG